MIKIIIKNYKGKEITVSVRLTDTIKKVKEISGYLGFSFRYQGEI